MKPIVSVLASLVVAVGLSACGSSGGGGGGGGSNPALNGTWEAELPDKTEPDGTMKKKVSVKFDGGSYQYTWYNKKIDGSGATVYDWAETAKETGSVSASTDFMQWTADTFAEAEYNAATHQWGALKSKKSDSGYNVQYVIDGNKMTLKEDINLDGDFDDSFDTPETITYIKK
jgi:hypothetical protein